MTANLASAYGGASIAAALQMPGLTPPFANTALTDPQAFSAYLSVVSAERERAAEMILVVEDEAEVREELVEMLELRRFAVLAADGVAAGLASARDTCGPLALLTDLRLGDGSGLDLVRAIRADTELAPRVAPIILMTGHIDLTAQVDRDIARQDLRMLFKPIDLGMLLPLLTPEERR